MLAKRSTRFNHHLHLLIQFSRVTARRSRKNQANDRSVCNEIAVQTAKINTRINNYTSTGYILLLAGFLDRGEERDSGRQILVTPAVLKKTLVARHSANPAKPLSPDV